LKIQVWIAKYVSPLISVTGTKVAQRIQVL